MTRYEFDWDRTYRIAALPFGITPARTHVELDHDGLRVRFGLWRLTTDIENLTSVDLTTDYRFVFTAGPPHLSFTDRGVSFATNGRRGACVTFKTPVAGIDPTGVIKHPGATLTVARPTDFARDLRDLLRA